MSEENIENIEPEETESAPATVTRRRFFTLRKALVGLGVVALVAVVAVVVVVVMYRVGVFDGYIKNQFVTKMADIGVVFEADTFRVAASPFTLELRNATFKDKTTGETLFFIRNANLAFSVVDLFSWSASRDIRIDRSDISGAEIWVKFDENGRSNFSNLHLVENEKGSAVNFRYESLVFSLQDSIIHFGDLSRRIGADAKNVTFTLTPEPGSVTTEAVTVAPGASAIVPAAKRYDFEASSTDSNFNYDGRTVEKIDIRAGGVADNTGAEIKHFELKTPLGDSLLKGTVTDWANPHYDLDVESSIDLTQATDIFTSGTTLHGIGNFKGHVTGTGENYHLEGTVDSEAIRAAGVYLKAVNVTATVEGTNTGYAANGKAVAAMLTFGDFQVDFPKMVGNVRGTGTDFRWVGELQAIAARSPALTLGGLFLSDAVAEYKDKQFRAQVGNGQAKRFAVGDLEFEDLRARELRFSAPNGAVDITSPTASARSLKTRDYQINAITGRNISVKNSGGVTTVDGTDLRSQNAQVHNTKLQNASLRQLKYKNSGRSNDLSATDLRIGHIDSPIGQFEGVELPTTTLKNAGSGPTVVYSDKLRVARVDTGTAVIGTLNIAGVRVSIKNGTIEGSTGDIDAGDVALTKSKDLPSGGVLRAVKLNRPVFIVEPASRYRATADMSIGGGVIGSVGLGAATAKVDVNNERLLLDQLNASVMDGRLTGAVSLSMDNRSQSRIDTDFSGLDLSKLAALQSGRVMPLVGNTTGNVHLTFPGKDFRSSSGKVIAGVTAAAGKDDTERIPINGNVELTATSGLFEITSARFHTDLSELSATGRFDLKKENSDLNLSLRSNDANEIARFVRVTGVSTDLEHQMDSLQIELAGKMSFDGTLTGNFYNPDFNGKASLDTFIMRHHTLGSVTTSIKADPTGIELQNGKLVGAQGGNADFSIVIPRDLPNAVSVKATLTNIDAGNLLAALPIDLPERISDLTGQTTGTVDIQGLPNKAQGSIDLTAAKGMIAGQNFDNLKAKAVFHGTKVDIENAEISVGGGLLTARGTYDRANTGFDLNLTGTGVPIPLALAFLPKDVSIPAVSGATDITANATGNSNRAASYNITFNGMAKNVTVGENRFGEVTFSGKTVNQILTADMTAVVDGRQQVINATLDFNNENMPFNVKTDFNQSPLAPYIAFVPQLKGVPVTGTATGKIEFGGNLRQKDDKGVYTTSASGLVGTANFSQLDLTIQDTPLSAAEPISIRFNTRELVFEKAHFTGGGSNMTISGTKALTSDGVNNLAIDGRVSLNLLNLAKTDVFFAGIADVAVRLNGPNGATRLSGTATTENASVATFIGSDRLTFDRIKTKVIFTANQAEVDNAIGYLGGGKFNGSGGLLLDGLSVQSFRFSVIGDNVTVPLPKDFLTTGNANLEISGIRRKNLHVSITGRVQAKRALYSKDIDLESILGGRREASLSSGSSTAAPIRYDLVIEGTNALVVRNNIADLTASVYLTLTGDANNPQLSGRITANSGTLFYRKDRYDIQRATLEFPPNTAIEPIINLQAETEIGGYQIFINLAGPLNDSEQMTATLRSSPALPQPDVVSLVTTGTLANTAGGIGALAQTGINTAAEILTDSIINNPARKATDKLFGLNVFELDPIISSQQANPTARLTVGRQINNNLRVTYSTNLSQDQNQVLALEYRVSNKLSFVAKYEQRSLTNVTRNRDNFSFEVRFRKRF